MTVTLNTETNIIKDIEYKTASSDGHATEGTTAEIKDETGSETGEVAATNEVKDGKTVEIQDDETGSRNW